MNIALIIGSVIVAIVFFVFAGVRAARSILPEDDPLFSLSFVLAVGMLFAGLHFFLISGKTFNYADGFSLQLPEGWEASQLEADFSDLGENISVYTDRNSSFVVGVTRMDKTDALRFKEDVKDAEKQRAAEIKNIEDKKLRAAAKKENYNVIKLHGIKWFAETDAQIKAVFNKRMYVIGGNGNYTAMVDTLNIKPFGFFRGMADGYLVPVQGINAFFNKSIHPYKTTNNGFIYLLGFILGAGVLACLLIWLINTIVQQVKLKAEQAKLEAERIRWQNRWEAMSVPEKIDWITVQYKSSDAEYQDKLEKLHNRYNSLQRNYSGLSPEKMLEKLNTLNTPTAGVGMTLGNIFTGGGYGAAKAKEHYEHFAKVYKYFQARYKIKILEMEIANHQYQYEREKTYWYSTQLKELLSTLTIKQKEMFDQAQKMDLRGNETGADNREIKKLIGSVQKFNADFKIRSEASWDKTLKFAGNMFKETSNYINQKSGKGTKKLSDADALVAGAGVAISLGSIALEAGIQYFDSIKTNKNNIAKYKEAEIKTLANIKNLEVNRSKAGDFVERANEINNYLEDSLQRYNVMWDEINTYLFPEGDLAKSKAARKKLEEQDGSLYTDEEMVMIMQFGRFTKMMATVADAEF
jgi:hypothetical protein